MLLALMLSLALHAGERKELVLHDGTVLAGEILFVDEEVYRLQSDTAGLVEVPVGSVQRVRSLALPAPGLIASPMAPAAAAAPAAMAAPAAVASPAKAPSQDILKLLLRLATEPAFREAILPGGDPGLVLLLSDPRLLQAVTEGDMAALQANAEVAKLLLRLEAAE